MLSCQTVDIVIRCRLAQLWSGSLITGRCTEQNSLVGTHLTFILEVSYSNSGRLTSCRDSACSLL
jgi:hypothetical protein